MHLCAMDNRLKTYHSGCCITEISNIEANKRLHVARKGLRGMYGPVFTYRISENNKGYIILPFLLASINEAWRRLTSGMWVYGCTTIVLNFDQIMDIWCSDTIYPGEFHQVM